MNKRPSPTALLAHIQRGAVPEHSKQDVRCGCCGYMTYHREHMGCIRAAAPAPDHFRDATEMVADTEDNGFDLLHDRPHAEMPGCRGAKSLKVRPPAEVPSVDQLWDNDEVMALNAELGLTMDQLSRLASAITRITHPAAPPADWRERFSQAVYDDLAAADNQDFPLEEYPARILKVLDAVIGREIKPAPAEVPMPAKCDGNHGGPRCADPECWNDPVDDIIDVRMAAKRLVKRALAVGVVLTIETQPRQPLAMGNYDLVVETREARKGGAA